MHGSRPNAQAEAADDGNAAGHVRLRRLLREPLTHFIALGLLIFATAHYLEQRSQRYVIDLGPAEMRRLAAAYTQQYGIAPSPTEMKALRDDYVRQEVLLREGLALGLEKDDEIVRRRIAQKFQFLLEDRTTAREPTEADLQTYYAGHRGSYVIAPRRTFDQRYYAIDQRGEDAARRLAQDALAALRAGRPAPAEDAFPGPTVVRLLSRADTDRLFGGEGFAAQTFAAPKDQWSGPYRSAFGWHVVRVTEDQPAQARAFAEVRGQVLSDWKAADRKGRNDAAYADVVKRYRLAGADPAR